ncbi:MAG: transglutaminase family protein [Cyclobacteriaceae bacterium]
MILSIEHSTRYIFEEKVFLEPHYLRFTPAPRPYYDLEVIDIQVSPKPSGFAERAGLENNIYHQAWFNDLLDELLIDVRLKLKIGKFNPFEFYIDTPIEGSLTKLYREEEQEALSLYLRCDILSDQMLNWSKEIKSSTGDNLITYLSFLNQTIHSEFTHVIREEDNLMTPTELFTTKVGSCRDLAWMMIHVLRNQGFAARYVGGYSFNPELEEGHELHAWVDVYLPGGGWVGMDPSAGIFVTETYIPICASYIPDLTKPVIGTYRGSASSRMETDVHIELSEGQ